MTMYLIWAVIFAMISLGVIGFAQGRGHLESYEVGDYVVYAAFASLFWPIVLVIAVVALPIVGVYMLGNLLGQKGNK